VLLHNVGNYRSYIIACAPGKTGDYTIPVGSLTNTYVNVFGSSFATCTGLTGVRFPASKLYSLGKGVFDGAYNLRHVDLSAITGTIDNATFNVDRNDADSPFYGMSDYTILYLPADEGHTAAAGEPNVVFGGTANRQILARKGVSTGSNSGGDGGSSDDSGDGDSDGGDVTPVTPEPTPTPTPSGDGDIEGTGGGE